ncbi:hypothetical protein PRIPAC_71835 [Pristionchus pacificus]|uniref:Uncharacterized protein n=1 Tax=Pristionchus pacificus TaxID=54126 RepID=A0A2A6BZL4_PRIPA|nr:hypothetical protein PRIPAC_71835 [Pristionchus pacificus]|eukprot:PDM71267.1 hypothetical protein PRIPAC_37674 [Pristionchus pacificus]
MLSPSSSSIMHLPILISVLVVFASSAPTTSTINHELAAKKFFGSLANTIQKGDHGELFDLLFAKWEHLYPGWISAEQQKELRAAFINFREKQDGDHPVISLALFRAVAGTIEDVEKEIKKRVFWHLNSEGKAYIKKVFASVPQELSGSTQLGQLSAKFDAFRAEYEALGDAAKKQLAKQFGVFANLDEVKAHITVFDNILGAAQTACENLPGFSECEHLKKE